MSSTAGLEDRKEKVGRQLQAITKTAALENRESLTPEERASFRRLEDEYTGLEASIRAAHRIASIEKDLRRSDPQLMNTMLGREEYTPEQLEADKRTHEQVFTRYLRKGPAALNEYDIRLLRRMMPDDGTEIRNAQTITTTGGGYLIPQGFSDQLEVAMKWTSGILSACGSFETATGNPLEWPTENDTGNTGSRVSVNVQLTEVDVTLGQISYASYIYATGPVLLPLALSQDSYFPIDQFLSRALGVRLGRVMNTDLTVGTGSNQPLGIVPAVVASGSVLTGATGETTTVSYNDLANLIEAVDEAYLQMPSCGWMMSQSTRKIIRKLVDSNNRPLWTDGFVSSGGVEQKGRLLGFPVTINNSMATMAANAYPILFGDMSKYMVRRVAGGSSVRRLVERYADYLQTGYVGYTRADGQLLDAGTHPLAAFQNSAS